MERSKQQGIFAEFRAAGYLKLAGILGVFVLLYAIAIGVLANNHWQAVANADFERLGQFGDSFGVVTAILNSLSVAALIITVYLQRKEMHDAAKSAESQLQQARAQLAITQKFEKLRLLPLVKAEWFPCDESTDYHYQLVVRNVGPGPAIINKVDVPPDYELAGSEDERWAKFITERMGGNEHDSLIHRMDFDELSHANRALAPNERQRYARIAFRFTDDGVPFLPLLRKATPVVYFFSVTGGRSDSESQFDFLIGNQES